MKRYRFFSKIVLSGLLLTALFSGCSADADSGDTYLTQMNRFVSEVSEIAAAIDALDAASPEAAESLSTELSRMDAAFREAAALSAPEAYADCDTAMSNAATYMSKACDTYAQALRDDRLDSSAITVAAGYYSSSMGYLARLGELLMSHAPQE